MGEPSSCPTCPTCPTCLVSIINATLPTCPTYPSCPACILNGNGLIPAVVVLTILIFLIILTNICCCCWIRRSTQNKPTWVTELQGRIDTMIKRRPVDTKFSHVLLGDEEDELEGTTAVKPKSNLGDSSKLQ